MASSSDIDAGWVSRLPAPPPHPNPPLAVHRNAREARLHELFQVDYDHALRQLPMPGWWPIIDELHDRLVALDPQYEFEQVKEKFGLLRVYARVSPDVARKADGYIRAAEARSAEICERCGETGTLRGGRRKLTLCDGCDAELPG